MADAPAVSQRSPALDPDRALDDAGRIGGESARWAARFRSFFQRPRSRSDLGSRYARWLLAILCAEVLIVYAFGLPIELNFGAWALQDPGGNLAIHSLLHQGLRPTIDFGYPYGLIPLLAGDIWFQIFGLSPQACLAAYLVCSLALAWAMARFAVNLKLGPAGMLLIIAAMPLMFEALFLNLTHAMEAALLANALAEQAAGKRARALALTTAACLTKPSMGYFYGLIILAWMAADLIRIAPRPRRIRLAVRMLSPAVATGITLSAILAAVFGPLVWLRTLLPSEGKKAYRILDFGFFARGDFFWKRPSFHLHYYVHSVVGFWIVATLWLLVAGIVAIRILAKSSRASRRIALRGIAGSTIGVDHSAEIVLTCALMQVIAVLVLWGTAGSWFKYFYLLVMGLAASTLWSSAAELGAYAMVVLAIYGSGHFIKDSRDLWRHEAPDKQLAGLWLSSNEDQEWTRALALARQYARDGHSTQILARVSGASVLFPEFKAPDTLYLDYGVVRPQELWRKLNELATARLVIAPHHANAPDPEYQAALEGCHYLWRGPFLDVCQRDVDASGAVVGVGSVAPPDVDMAQMRSAGPRHNNRPELP